MKIADNHFRLDFKQFLQMFYRTCIMAIDETIFKVADVLAENQLILGMGQILGSIGFWFYCVWQPQIRRIWGWQSHKKCLK